MKVFSPEALLVYQVQVPDVKYMGPAGRGEQSNPIVTKNRMFGYSFSPGFVFALRAKDGDLVITGTNEPSAVALNKHTGEIEWKRKLDGSCGDQLVAQGGQAVAVTKKSIYFLALESGKVTSRIKRKGRVRLGNPVVAGKLVCVLETDNRIRKISCNKLLLIEDHRLKKVVSLRPRILINYSYFKNKDALYISHFHGLDIFDIKTRKVKIQIKKKNIFFATVAAVVARRIYVFDQYGKLYVMRDPSSLVSRS